MLDSTELRTPRWQRRAWSPAISTVFYVTDRPLRNTGSRKWKLSATLVGLVAMFVAGWTVNALDMDNSAGSYVVAWLAIAVGFIGIATAILIPRSQSRQHRRPSRGAHRS